jgi:small subunit ribosomal protein S16
VLIRLFCVPLIAPSWAKRLNLDFEDNMVVIRLARGGSTHRPFHHIVATDKRHRRDSGAIERLGFVNPIAKGTEEGVRIKLDRIAYWESVGAQLSPTVARLVKQMRAATPAA